MSDHNVQEVEIDPLLKAKGWWDKNQKQTLIVIAAVIIIVGGWLGYKYFISEPNESKANLAIYKAEENFRVDSFKLALNGDGSVSGKGFLSIIKNFSGTKAGNLAKYYAGICYLQTGDFKNAVKYLEDFSTSSKQIQMMDYGALADAYSELGKNDDAVTYYKKAAETFPADELNASEYLFRAASFEEKSGKSKQALDLYNQLKEQFPTSARGKEADKYIYHLEIPANDISSK